MPEGSDPIAPLPRIRRDFEDPYSEEAAAAWRELAGLASGVELRHLAGQPVPTVQARGNVENLIGFAQVQVGLAGPLRFTGSEGPVETYVPLATTKGAMVASYSRGMGVLAEAGTLRATTLREGLSQHPMFVYRGLAQAVAAREQVADMVPRFQAITDGLTNHGKLVEVAPELLGRRLILRLVFTTGEAIGINLAARAAELLGADFAEASGASEFHAHGQDVEKRANARALVQGRGRSVAADALLPRELVERRLRTTPEALAAIARSYAIGFAQLGTQNWTIQTANGLAALFVACGQDVAYVTESATGHLELECTAGGDLYAAIHLPNLLVGTVWGGSGQGTAAECLALMGCAGAGRFRRLGEIAAARCLAGDLSLMAAFTAGEFSAAHERLGRNRSQAPG